MRILVVKSEKNLGAVVSRVTMANASAEVTARAEAAFRAVNPGVDFNRLKPGDVLMVPDTQDIGPGQGDTISGAVLSPVVENAKATLAQLKNRLTSAESDAGTERDTLARLLKSKGLQTAMSQDQSLKEDVRAVQSALAQEIKDAADRKKVLTTVFDQVAADLDHMRQRFG